MKQIKLYLTLALLALGIGQMWGGTDVTFNTSEIAGRNVKSYVTPCCSISSSNNKICTSSNVALINMSSSADTDYTNDEKRIAFKVENGKGTISKIVIHGSTNSSGNGSAAGAIVYWDDNTFPTSAIGYATPTFLNYTQNNSCDGHYIEVTPPAGTKAIAIYKRVKYNSSSNTVGSGSNTGAGTTLRVDEVTLTIEPECSDAAATFTVNSGASASIYTTGTATLAFSSSNESAVVYSVTKDAVAATANTDYTIVEGVFTPLAGAGKYVITATQAADGTHCEVDESVTVTVNVATPVTSAVASVDVNKGIIGDNFTLQVTAANATDFQWYSNTTASNEGGSAIVSATNNEYVFTPADNGVYYFYATATNEFTTTPIVSNCITITITEPCYDILYDLVNSIGSAAVTANDATVNAGVSLVLTNTAGRITITPAEGYQFKNGDIIDIAGTIGNTSKKWGIKINNSQTLEKAAGEPCELTGTLSLASDQATIEIGRADGSTTTLTSCVIKRRVACKEIISTVITLSAVTVNSTAISAANLATLQSDHTLALAESFAAAPVIVFNEHKVITYEDNSQKVTDTPHEVTATVVSGNWQAQATINSITYTVTATKLSSATVSYYDGATKLGEEIVAINGHPAEYGDYETKAHYTFAGWYNNSDLADGHAVANISAETITADASYYGKWTAKYASSVNFEKMVMDNGKSYDFLSQLGTLGYETNITGSLDGLDNTKSDSLRNYSYLGLKVKSSGAMLDFLVASGKTVYVKFGNVGKTPKVSYNGGSYADMTITDNVYTYTTEAETIISIKTADGSAVVFQQVMIGETLQDPELYLITYADASNGTVSGWKMGIPGETITVYPKPASGYKLKSGTLTVVDADSNPVDLTGATTFEMPAKNVTVSAEFEDATTTSLTDLENGAQPKKVIENGVLYILRDGKTYNAQGIQVK